MGSLSFVKTYPGQQCVLDINSPVNVNEKSSYLRCSPKHLSKPQSNGSQPLAPGIVRTASHQPWKVNKENKPVVNSFKFTGKGSPYSKKT